MIFKYKGGSLRKGVYGDLNLKWKDSKLPRGVLKELSKSVRYGKVKRISVVVYTRNRLENLRKYVLNGLEKIDFPKKKFEVIIVDNSLNNRTWEYLRTLNKTNYRIFREKRKGICFTLTKGIKESKGDIIAFLEDDMVVDSKWLRRIEKFHNSGKYLLGQGLIYDVKLKRILNKFDRVEEERNFADGNSAYRKDIFDFVSFNENIIYGAEGYDLISQVFVFWPGFKHYLDRKPINHYRAVSEYRDYGSEKLNKKGINIEKKMYGLWYANKHILKRNLNIDKRFFCFRFWIKELLFLPLELMFVYGDAIILITTKRKIYRQLKHLRKII